MQNQLNVTVLGLNYAPEPFGIAPYTTALCRGLAGRGHHVNVVTGVPHYPQWRVSPEYRWTWTAQETIDGVPVKRVRHPVPAGASNLRRVLMEAAFGARAAASDWHHPDVILCTTPALVATAMQCARRRAAGTRRPALGLWVQDLYAVGLCETQARGCSAAGLVSRLEGWVMRQADGIVVAHDRFGAQLVDNLHVDPAKVTVIKNWTHVRSDAPADRAQMRSRLGWSADETVVLHSGNMGIKQGLDNVVRAAQIADARNLDLRFVLMGDGNQRRTLEALGRGTTRLQILDPLPETEFLQALAAADILLVNEKPGVAEMSIPSKLTSYFQSGTAVLAAISPDGNAAQQIRKSGAGMVIGAGDPLRLVEAALLLGGAAELRAELGANGIRYAAQELSETASIDAFDRWMRRMVAPVPTPAAGLAVEAQEIPILVHEGY